MFDFKKKDLALQQSINYCLAKTLSMFEWEGLPKTIPARELEKLLQVHGFAFIIKHDDELYAVSGGLGGEQDVYGNYTKITVANPALKLTKTFDIKTEGVLIRSDDLMMGLKPLLIKFNSMLVENDLSMVINSYATRMQLLISASDDKTRKSVESYLQKLIDGDLAAIGENALFDGIKTHKGSSQNNDIKNLIEYHQYIKANLFNEIGLDASFNMKRERLNSAEVGQNNDGLYPFIDDMMKCRLEAVEELESFYGLTLKVGYGSIWGVKNKRLVDGVISEETLINEEGEENESEQKPVDMGNSGDDSSDGIQPEEREGTEPEEIAEVSEAGADAEEAEEVSEAGADAEESEPEIEAEEVEESEEDKEGSEK